MIDDLMHEAAVADTNALFSKYSLHLDIRAMFILQIFFRRGQRTVHSIFHCIVLFENHCDKASAVISWNQLFQELWIQPAKLLLLKHIFIV